MTQRGHPQEFGIYSRKLRAKTDLRDYNKFIMTCVSNAMEKLGKKRATVLASARQPE